MRPVDAAAGQDSDGALAATEPSPPEHLLQRLSGRHAPGKAKRRAHSFGEPASVINDAYGDEIPAAQARLDPDGKSTVPKRVNRASAGQPKRPGRPSRKLGTRRGVHSLKGHRRKKPAEGSLRRLEFDRISRSDPRPLRLRFV
jgi:hypothetical protein